MKKTFEFRKEQGISIRKLDIVFVVIAVVASAVLFVAMNRTTAIHKKSAKLTRDVIVAQRQADTLMEASDYLTEEMRKFVVTGERRYLNNYFEEAQISKRREKSLEAIKNINDKSVAYHNLEAAMHSSEELMKTEYYAAKLAIQAYGYNMESYPEAIKNLELRKQDENMSDEDKMKTAVDMLFNEEYSDRKNHISSHISKCLEELNEELDTQQLELEAKLKHQVFLEHVLTVVLIVILLGVVFLTAYLIIVPLTKAVDHIRDEQDVPLTGAYEVRFLAKTYNLMYQTNLVNKEKLSFEATHDKLTGRYNRRGYDFLLKNVDMETSTLLIIDLDTFKKINDTFGHDVGDKVLIKAADVLYNSFRQQDYVCRIGGDEFAVIMVHSGPSLKSLIERKVQIMNEKMSESGNGIPESSFSVGVAFGENGESVEQIFKNADAALYEAKKSGKCSVVFHE